MLGGGAAGAVCNPFGVEIRELDVCVSGPQGGAPRLVPLRLPWAVICNRFAVSSIEFD